MNFWYLLLIFILQKSPFKQKKRSISQLGERSNLLEMLFLDFGS